MHVTEFKTISRCSETRFVCRLLFIVRFQLTKRSEIKVLQVKVDKTHAINSLKRGEQKNRPETVNYILLKLRRQVVS